MNIFVGNLSRDVTEEDLREAFSAFGQISKVTILKDKFSGEPRGFGFVEMPAKAEAQAKREQQEQREMQADEQRLAKQREDNLKRMPGQAGAGIDAMSSMPMTVPSSASNASDSVHSSAAISARLDLSCQGGVVARNSGSRCPNQRMEKCRDGWAAT